MDRPEAIDRLWVKYHVDPSLIPRSRIQVDMCDPGIAKYSARLAEVRVRETPASPDVKEANAFDDRLTRCGGTRIEKNSHTGTPLPPISFCICHRVHLWSEYYVRIFDIF
jgi:hypothetical protein